MPSLTCALRRVESKSNRSRIVILIAIVVVESKPNRSRIAIVIAALLAAVREADTFLSTLDYKILSNYPQL